MKRIQYWIITVVVAMALPAVSWFAIPEAHPAEIIKPTHQSQSQETCCPIVELRQYTLHPGKRDDLIDLFDREFVETQEAVGMTIIGQFRDLNNPDRFVWLRGFHDMPSRAQALTDFYGGPVWKAHSAAARATMIDATNVLLLHPSRSSTGFLRRNDRPPVGGKAVRKRFVVGTIYYFETAVTDDFVSFFESKVKPLMESAGASVLAYFVTESSANTFPRLPVREGENVFVWFSSFRDQSAFKDYATRLDRLPRWQNELSKDLKRQLKREPEVLKLAPTERSEL